VHVPFRSAYPCLIYEATTVYPVDPGDLSAALSTSADATHPSGKRARARATPHNAVHRDDLLHMSQTTVRCGLHYLLWATEDYQRDGWCYTYEVQTVLSHRVFSLPPRTSAQANLQNATLHFSLAM
jgi:hypothetical protein